MLSALYYPHTDIKSQVILKNSLLLWDKIETIVPDETWTPHRFTDKASNEAVDLIVRARKPNREEKQSAHDALLNLSASGSLSKLMEPDQNGPSLGQNRDMYPIYHEKFLHETWRMLESRGVANFSDNSFRHYMPPALGFLMMSLLADACAGTQTQKITDRADAYSWLSECYANALNSTLVKGFDVSQVAPGHDRLVTLSLEVLDARDVPLKNLVAFRRREASGGGTAYGDMRRKYLETLQAHIKRVCAEAKTTADVIELDRVFKNELASDLADLKQELQLANINALFSKEVAVSVVLTAGALASPIAGLTELGAQVGWAGVVPLVKAAVELKGARRAALLKHKSSWLYMLGGRFKRSRGV